MEKNEIVNKLATFKADINLVTFDQSTFNFLKDRVHPEWNAVSARGKAHEMRLDELV